MPGEPELLEEFVRGLRPRALVGVDPTALRRIVRETFDRMSLAAEAGTLLRIEDDLRAAVRRETGDFLVGDERGTEERWVALERDALDALRAYSAAEGHGPAYLRRLFARDAHRGFAFVDVCRRRFDVVLMNPPFGEASKPSKGYIDKAYPRTKNDLYAAFVERGLELLEPGGLLGAITSRTGFFLSSFQMWREEILLDEGRLTVVADLGQGVLDTAMVETAAYCIEKAAMRT